MLRLGVKSNVPWWFFVSKQSREQSGLHCPRFGCYLVKGQDLALRGRLKETEKQDSPEKTFLGVVAWADHRLKGNLHILLGLIVGGGGGARRKKFHPPRRESSHPVDDEAFNK